VRRFPMNPIEAVAHKSRTSAILVREPSSGWQLRLFPMVSETIPSTSVRYISFSIRPLLRDAWGFPARVILQRFFSD
jgi:hypothetical protein